MSEVAYGKGRILLAVALPFFLNDLQNLFVRDFELWLLVDYALRVAVLAFLLSRLRAHRLDWADLGFREWRKDRVLACLLVFGLAYFVGDALLSVAFRHSPFHGLGSIPHVDDPGLWKLDRYAGQFMVALSEETVFRGLLLSVCREKGLGRGTTVLASVILFSAIHWSLSGFTLSTTALFGALFMVATMFSGSIVPAIVAHYVMNVLYYI